ncbi:hypothetical protein LIER_25688 [Lithospermum erythrorhizon]|uniref:RNase H type-1 domain-containing protein n=1 Tax=Lithospermum erythrorhizon TaxID=34254 RepID=A0AAV3R8X3_LITER
MHHTKGGTYFTCSGYKSAKAMKRNGELIGHHLGHIWKVRNRVVFEEEAVELEQVWKASLELEDNYKRACSPILLPEELTVREQASPTDIDKKWTKPQQGWIKLNTDASWLKSTRFRAGGAVCRDANGDYLGATCWKLVGADSPFMVETSELRGGLEFAYYNQWRNIDIESDSKELINILTRKQYVTTEVEVLMGDIQYLAS